MIFLQKGTSLHHSNRGVATDPENLPTLNPIERGEPAHETVSQKR
jgi:hypothetical protein